MRSARSERQPQAQLIEPPSATERRLRARIGEAVAAQAVEDEAGLQVPHSGEGLYHRYNAVLKRVFGNKGRAADDLAGARSGPGVAGAQPPL